MTAEQLRDRSGKEEQGCSQQYLQRSQSRVMLFRFWNNAGVQNTSPAWINPKGCAFHRCLCSNSWAV
jgi:hypothetical protein